MVTLLLWAALGFAADRPDWVSGRAASYPSARYLTGVGQGTSPEKAADRARTEVAKAFSVSLYSAVEASARETSSGGSSSYREEVSDEVRSATAKVLDGLEIAQRWQDETGAHYALAVLDREHSLKVVADKLGELDGEFSRLAQTFRESAGRWERLGLGLRLLDNARARKELNSDHRILSPDGKGLPSPAAAADDLKQARLAVSSVTIRLEVEGDEDRLAASRLKERLARHGLKVRSSGEDPDLLIRAKSEGQVQPAENLLWLWASARLEVSLIHDGEELERFSLSGQAEGRSPESAVRKAVAALADKAGAQAYRTLVSSRLQD